MAETPRTRQAPLTRYDEWMSETDAMLWHVERDPLLRSTITSVWVLDRAPDLARFEATLERAVAEVPRLRQRVRTDPLGLAPPRWEDDPHFDPAYHMRRVRVAGDGTLRDLLDLAAPIGMQAFDKDRPLWELHQVEGLEGGKSGIVMKLHHAVSDGVGMLRMTESLVERSREEHTRPRTQAAPAPLAPRGDLADLRDAIQQRLAVDADRAYRLARTLGGAALDLLRDPTGTLTRARDTASSVGRLMRPVSEPLSPVLRGRSISWRFDVVEVPVEDFKRAGKAAGGTVNDAFLAAVTGGLRRYHEDMGEPVDALRVNMPINVREGEKGKRAGNQFVPARFALPVADANPAARMRAIGDLVREQRSEPALPLLDEISGVMLRLGVGPAIRIAGGMMKALDLAASNVPGPRFPVFASGARIERMFPFGPTGGAAMNVTLFSYDGVCQIGLNSDLAAVREPELLADCLRKGVDEVLSVV